MSTTGGRELNQPEADVARWVETNQEYLFETLADLVRFKTPNPPGGNEMEAQQWIEVRLGSLGLEIDRWDVLPGRPNIVGVLRGSGRRPSVVLNAHVDVCQDALLDSWSTGAYEPFRRGREMFGRGVSDAKSGIASFLVAVESLIRCDVKLHGSVLIQSVIGEETGGAGTRSALERGHRGDFAIVGEPTRGRGLVACVGVLTFRVTIASPVTLHLNARRLTLQAGGQLKGANCVEKMATRIVLALLDLEREWAVFRTHALVPAGTSTINMFHIEGEAGPFTMPDRCVAHFTVVYLPHEQRADIIAEVEERIDTAAKLDGWLRDNPPIVEWSPADFPMEFVPCDFDPAQDAIRELGQVIHSVVGREPEWGGRGGITDAGWFAQSGVPAVVFGPGDPTQAHAVDECVHLDDLVNHCKSIAVFLTRYCRVRSG